MNILQMHAGDMVHITGEIITARDRAHKYLLESDPHNLPFNLKGAILYHCGPIVRKEGDQYVVVAGGPTTSSRLEPYTADIIEKYGISMIIGKAGMGPKTLAALKGRAVYCAAVGGAAQVLAHSIKKVKGVYMLEEFGAPEAFWVLEVEHFPVVVTMDAHGVSLHQNVKEASLQRLQKLLGT